MATITGSTRKDVLYGTAKNDIISLASDITSDQLWFSHVGNDLKISVICTSDSYTVKNWYSGSSNQVEQLKAANGKVLSNTNVEKLVQAI